MYNSISLTGDFSIDKLKKVLSQLEVLASQPPLEVHEIFADKNPEFSYRKIFVSYTGPLGTQIQYHVMDMGRIRNAPDMVSLGDKIYLEEEVEKLK